jgi:hypothetical protein
MPELAADPEQFDRPALRHACWEAGQLSWLLQPHQVDDYDAFREWNQDRQTRDHLAWVRELGALYDNLWVDECGRRHGKTARALVVDVEEMIQRPGCRGLIATPLAKSIGGIIVPLTKILFAGAPDGYFPKYVRSHGPDGPGLYIEAVDSYCKLIGLDKNPDATRGEYLDFAHISEAGFVKGLYELVTSVLMPQFRYRPHAWLAMETSTAKVADCEFNSEFREDAKLRGAYRTHTIRDNTSLTEDEIDQEERRSGGAGSAQCQRELYCELTRDPDDMVVPEFDESVHVVAPELIERPRYALAHVGFDPGTTDPHGLVWLYFDWSRQCIVVEGAWARSNASTGTIAATVQEFEARLWGAAHRAPGERKRELSIREALMTGDDKVWEAPQAALTYWDAGEYSLKPNPYSRISDIDNQFVLDMNTDHGMNVRKALKGPGSKEADTEHLRVLFGARPVKIVIVRNGHTEPLIMQLRSGEWNTDETGHRTDWKRTKTLGHLDCIAALKYVVRDVQWTKNPNKPAFVDPHMQLDHHVPDEIRGRARGAQMPVYGGRGRHSYVRPAARTSR